ncbi:MAG TPA: DUF262 domain-containing protein [Actinomycetales bacterium]|nr:DUF262 domain-containing protein [Actinomycetales bacterium]
MGFQTPMYELRKYLEQTNDGTIQLPDFQRGYKWDDERIRQILITVLRGHPMGVVMLLETGNALVRFKPRPIEGTAVPADAEPKKLLLDGQQRLTSLTQALTGDGVVDTKDHRGKLMTRRYFVNMGIAVEDPSRMEEAVISVPADGVVRTNFNRDIVLDLSSREKQQSEGYFPLGLLFSDDAISWIFGRTDWEIPYAREFYGGVVEPARRYQIPAIELDSDTDKFAVATVFEKVNIGGLPLNVFELLTSVFAGDGEYYARTGEDFRLNDDWQEIRASWKDFEVLSRVGNTDFLQAVTMLSTLEKNQQSSSGRPPAVSAKREDILKLELNDYLKWRDPLRDAFVWVVSFLADRHIFRSYDIPYMNQLIPLAVIRVILGKGTDLHSSSARLIRWYWAGVLGELYGSATDTRFVRDLEQVPAWVRDPEEPTPKTVLDANFVESRLHSMRTRNSAAYKGLAALAMTDNSSDWMEDKVLGAFQYKDLEVDIHHIFPKRWCDANGIDIEHRESIVNKTMISAHTNRVIGGAAPSEYLAKIEARAEIEPEKLDGILAGHFIDPDTLRADDFERFFRARRNALCGLIERTLDKAVQRDISQGIAPEEDSAQFESEPVDDEE